MALFDERTPPIRIPATKATKATNAVLFMWSPPQAHNSPIEWHGGPPKRLNMLQEDGMPVQRYRRRVRPHLSVKLRLRPLGGGACRSHPLGAPEQPRTYRSETRLAGSSIRTQSVLAWVECRGLSTLGKNRGLTIPRHHCRLGSSLSFQRSSRGRGINNPRHSRLGTCAGGSRDVDFFADRHLPRGDP